MITNLMSKIINNIWPMLVVFTLAITLFRFFYLQHHRERFHFHKEVCYLIAIIYIWLLFEILTMTELNSASGINFTPFSEILRYKIGSKLFYYNVIGNIIIFIPFGFIFGEYVSPKKIWSLLMTTILTSTAVEFVQLKIGRSFDIDDIILNLFGAILGYLVYVGLNAISKKLPKFMKSDLIYNIICIILIILFIMYVFGYWSVIFK